MNNNFLLNGLRFKGLSHLCLGFALVFVTMQSSATTLVDAVHQTLLTNPDLLSFKAKEASAAQDIDVVQGELYPTIDITAGYGSQYSDNAATRGTQIVGLTGGNHITLTRRESEIFIRQLLFDGGAVRGRIAQREFDYSTAEYRVLESSQRLAFDAVKAYFDILRYRQILEVRKLDIIAHKDMLAKVQKRLEAGAGLKSDISLAKARLALAYDRRDSTAGLLKDAYDIYIKTVGIPVGTSMTDPGSASNLPRSLEQAQTLALEINPSIGAALAQTDAAKAQIGIAKSAFYPRFTLDLSATHSRNLDGVPGRSDDRQATVRMTYNMFRGGTDKAAVKSATDLVVSAEDDVDTIRRNVLQDVALSWNDWQTNKNRSPYLAQYRDDSLETFQSYVKQFQLGQRTLFDLLNAQAEYYDARVNYINNFFDMRNNSYRILAGMGNLVSTLSQGVDVPVSQPLSDNVTVEQHKPTGHSLKHPARNSQLTPTGTVAPESSVPPKPSGLTQAKNDFYSDHPETFQKSVTVATSEPQPKQEMVRVASNESEFLSDELSMEPVLAQTEEMELKTDPVKVAKSPEQASTLPSVPDANHYTLQLMASRDPSVLERFIEQHQLQGKAQYYAANISGQTWYRLVYGDYTDQEEAKNAISHVASSIGHTDAVVRQFASIQANPIG